jgi:hypothetical protein
MLERTDAIMNEVLEPITFLPAYPNCTWKMQNTEVVSQLHNPATLPYVIKAIKQEPGWAPEPFWVLGRTEKSLVPARIKPWII